MGTEKYFEKVLHLFPDGLVFYCAERGLIYTNNYTKKLCLTLASGDQADETNLEKYDIGQVLDGLIEKSHGSHSLRQRLNNIYHQLSRHEIGQKISSPEDGKSLMTDLCYENEFTHKPRSLQAKEFHVRVSITEFKDRKPCFMVQITDISERVRLQEAKVADGIKTMMLCSISHELRTPLNQIKGMIELSMNTIDLSLIYKFLRISDRASNMLLHKIDDILDYYEVESGKFVSKPGQVSIKKFLKEIDGLMRPQIEEKDLFFSMHVATDLADTITFDKIRISRVIINLLNNAIKYTQSGFITLIVSMTGNNSIRFSISDTGCGIVKEKQKSIFKLFGKFKDNANSAAKLGGLGLSISQVLLNKLGSELKCSSSVNVGTRFYFDITVPERISKDKQELESMNGVRVSDLHRQNDKRCDNLLTENEEQGKFLKFRII
jgi:signal transduction histidine kinase